MPVLNINKMNKEDTMAKELPGYGTINVPKDREVPFGAITPAPVCSRSFSDIKLADCPPGDRRREMHTLLHLLSILSGFLLVI